MARKAKPFLLGGFAFIPVLQHKGKPVLWMRTDQCVLLAACSHSKCYAPKGEFCKGRYGRSMVTVHSVRRDAARFARRELRSILQKGKITYVPASRIR